MQEELELPFGPESPKQEMILDSEAQILIIGGAAGCLQGSTEFLTPSGWKPLRDYTEGDEVAEFDVGGNEITFRKPSHYIKAPCKEFSVIQSKNFKMTLTPEHTVLYYDSKDQPYTADFATILDRHEKAPKGFWGRIKSSFQAPSQDNLEDDSDIVQKIILLGNMDKTTYKDDGKAITTFTNKPQYYRFLFLCRKYGVKYEDLGRYNIKGWSVSTVIDKEVKELPSTWFTLSQRQATIVYEQIREWILTKKSKTVSFYNESKQNVDIVQHIMATQGYISTINKVDDLYECKSVRYKSGCKSLTQPEKAVKSSKVKSEDGYKYCFTTESGFFVVRENGHIYVTGNSGKSYLLQMLPLAIIDDPMTSVIMFRRTTPQIKGLGGLFDTARNMYNQLPESIRPRFREQAAEAIFPSGAKIQWKHMENVKDKENHQGLICSPLT